MPDSAPPPIGDNQAPADANPLLDRLNKDHAALLKRRDDLFAAIGRTPTEIPDEETAGKMADFVDMQIDAFLERVDEVHKTEKAPFKAAVDTVDSFWHTLKDAIAEGKKNINKVRKAYADKKDALERARRQEAARLAQEEADRKAREAEAARRSANPVKAAVATSEATQAAAVAEQAAEATTATPAQLGRSTGAGGGTTSLTRFWDHADLDRNKIDLEALRHHLAGDAIDKAIKAWIKVNKNELPAKQIAGVRIFQNTRI